MEGDDDGDEDGRGGMAVRRGKGEKRRMEMEGEGGVREGEEKENASRQRRGRGRGGRGERYNDDPDSRVEHVKPPVPQQLIDARIIRRWMTGYSYSVNVHVMKGPPSVTHDHHPIRKRTSR